jgi:hypothetical protein
VAQNGGDSPKITVTWLEFLRNAELTVLICANVVLLYSVYPAYKRTRNVGLLLLGYGYLISTFVTVCDLTIGRDRMSAPVYNGYHTVRAFCYIIDAVLCTVGLLLLLRAFLDGVKAGPETPETPNPEPDKPPGFVTKLIRKIEE